MKSLSFYIRKKSILYQIYYTHIYQLEYYSYHHLILLFTIIYQRNDSTFELSFSESETFFAGKSKVSRHFPRLPYRKICYIPLYMQFGSYHDNLCRRIYIIRFADVSLSTRNAAVESIPPIKLNNFRSCSNKSQTVFQ